MFLSFLVPIRSFFSNACEMQSLSINRIRTGQRGKQDVESGPTRCEGARDKPARTVSHSRREIILKGDLQNCDCGGGAVRDEESSGGGRPHVLYVAAAGGESAEGGGVCERVR